MHLCDDRLYLAALHGGQRRGRLISSQLLPHRLLDGIDAKGRDRH
jgi:hypothetical protein